MKSSIIRKLAKFDFDLKLGQNVVVVHLEDPSNMKGIVNMLMEEQVSFKVEFKEEKIVVTVPV